MSVNHDFAHGELRDVAFQAPGKMLEALTSEDGPGLLAGVWDRMRAAAGGRASPGHDIALDVRLTAGGDTLVVVLLPDARQVADVIYAGLLFSKPTRRPPFFRKTTGMRYFTLEFARHDGGRPTRFLCEWVRSDGGFGHRNTGVRVDPVTVDGFAAALEATLLVD